MFIGCIKNDWLAIFLCIRRKKRLWGEIFFQNPDALHELIRAMATGCAEIALACVHLPIFLVVFRRPLPFAHKADEISLLLKTVYGLLLVCK